MKENQNYDNVRLNTWRKENPDKVLSSRIRSAYRLLVRCGIIDGEKVLTNPTI